MYLTYYRQITTDSAMQKAKDLEVLFMEVSAKSGHNINNLFKTIAMSLPSNEISQIVNTVTPNSNVQQPGFSTFPFEL